MRTLVKPYYQLFYFIGSLFFMESVLRVSIADDFFGVGLLFSFIYSIFYGVVIYVICVFFEKKTNYLLSYLFLLLFSIIFGSQFIYFKVFKTFYTIYSASNASQIAEFWKSISIVVAKNLTNLLLIFLPLLLLSIYKDRIISYKANKEMRIHFAGFLSLTYLVTMLFVFAEGKEQYSAYDLYFKKSYPILSVKKLGLVTTMRLDLKRMLIGWSPPVESLPETIVKKPVKQQPNPEKKVEYNTMKIDFSNLILNEKDETLKNMHMYFENVEPTEKNEYTGKYKGYNLILITAEAFSPYAVDENLTPTLHKMVYGGYYFADFYTPVWGVSTSDGEYVACTGLIPKSGVWSFFKSGKNSMPFVMGNQLKNLGYKTMAYHNHTYNYYKRDISHPNMGYVYKGVGSGLNMEKRWPESDLEMMQITMPEYIDNIPFHAYYMTVSGHLRYNFLGNAMSSKNKGYVKGLPYSEPCRAYIACQIELDRALEYLENELEKKGLDNKTLIALSADHYPYGLENCEIDELAGHTLERNFELHKNHFILYTKGMTPKVINKPCSSLDIIPTISNLLGLKYDSRLLMGKDILSDAEPLVIFGNRSFITDKGRYNSENKTFTPVKGVNVDEDYVKDTIKIVDSKFYYSAKILDTDYYNIVLGK
jgi:lipoteichoic acid synthase